MTAQDIKKEFSEIESLKSTELRGECFIDFGQVWHSPKKEIKTELTKRQALCYWLLVGLAVATIIFNLIVLIK